MLYCYLLLMIKMVFYNADYNAEGREVVGLVDLSGGGGGGVVDGGDASCEEEDEGGC